MKRRLLIIAIFLLLGAVVNVAVAWGCALLAPNAAFRSVSARLILGLPDRPFFHRLYLRPGLLPEDMLPPDDPQESTYPMPAITWVIHEWGLPLVSMRSESIKASVILPWRPLWPSFAINTTFYATLLWLLIPGPFVLRRFLRLRRGLCPKCAYPMGDSSVCTECGKPLPSRVRVA